MRILAVAATLAVLLHAAPARAEQKLGLVDLQRALNEVDEGKAEGRASGKSLRKCPPRLSSRRQAATAIINPTSAGSAAALWPSASG